MSSGMAKRAPSESPVRDVTDTARWVAHYRALESERPHGILSDPLARHLAGERGRAIAEALPKLSLEWVIPVRAKVYDELIVEALAEGGIDTVLNLAAGLDTRPYRLDLPTTLRWVEADLPAIVTTKTAVLAGERTHCELRRVELDLTDGAGLRALLSELERDARRVLVVTEGVLAYLDESTVSALARALHASPAVQAWLLEAAMPEVLARARRAWGKVLEPAGAGMKFAPASGLDFFAPFGWAPRRTRSLLEEAERLGRGMRFARLARLVTKWLRGEDAWRKLAMYGVMERAAPEAR
jgi:methyltransferase (TIGR00027 family)